VEASLPAVATRALSLSAPELRDLVREVTSRGMSIWCVATGNSMRPTITHRSRVCLRAASAGVSVGDVVLAEVPDGRVVLHRVRARTEGMLTLQGDALPVADPPTSIHSVAGVVEAIAIAPEPSKCARTFGSTRFLRACLTRLHRGRRMASL
jgi:hypothetical protein